jgi:hypothetical protein
MTDTQAADRLRHAVDELKAAIEAAQDLGLRVDVAVNQVEFTPFGMSRRSFLTAVDVSTWREVKP